ncbi:hypothetical protein OG689_10690 [Kitasatospora sp. NBC_00240]|uniref:hypothetical protein n=1 Tax=Kitasatospora sp. NBC_00240 TaxID=2903567 RepID=UPI00224D35D3|nr:hypothetical protein [Kitasatospora sp. NBC_00240]MCX5209750.1 hypothetical protein [Kitasatospora sp. NBC_00240]
MTDWTEQANAIATRYEHGHDTLTADCSLCLAEYDEVMAVSARLRAAERPCSCGTDCLASPT